jgi:methionine synthase II (cobalamin-independent)
MPIPTEPVGSLPRPMKLQKAFADYGAGKTKHEELEREQVAACLDSIKRSEATGEPVVSDGEQRMSSVATYPLTDRLAGTGLADHLAADGQYFAIFTDGRPRVESPEEARDALMEASKHIPKERLGPTDDCGFSPFSIDVKPKRGSPDVARDIAFQKITSRVKGTAMASEKLGVA